MSLSYYEVYITSLRALTAMGFPYGLNEDAAFMTTWLELHKLDGIKKLSEASQNFKKYFNNKIILKDLRSSTSINLHKASLLLNGPNLFDYLNEETIKNKQLETSFYNCFDPIYIIPLAKKFLINLEFIRFCWLKKNKKITCINIKKNKILIGEAKNNLEICDGQVLLQFMHKNKKYTWKNNLGIKKINHEINFNIEQKHLEESLKPKKIHWEIVKTFANLTFVPTSAKSREKGAGGGNDND